MPGVSQVPHSTHARSFSFRCVSGWNKTDTLMLFIGLIDALLLEVSENPAQSKNFQKTKCREGSQAVMRLFCVQWGKGQETQCLAALLLLALGLGLTFSSLDYSSLFYPAESLACCPLWVTGQVK